MCQEWQNLKDFLNNIVIKKKENGFIVLVRNTRNTYLFPYTWIGATCSYGRGLNSYVEVLKGSVTFGLKTTGEDCFVSGVAEVKF